MSEASPGGPTPPTPSTVPTRRSFGARLLGALKLDAAVYDEVEHDPDALPQAGIVVVLASLAEGLGAIAVVGVLGLLGGVLGGLIGWVVSAGVVWLIGVKIMDHTSDFPELLRTLGFASAPALLSVLGILPLGPLRPVLGLVVFALLIVAFVIAVRQALDVTTGRAVLVCVLAVLARMVIVALLVGGAALVT